MGADDGVHPVGLKQLFDGLLGLADGVVVLAAPVEHGDGDVRLLLLHRRHNGGDFVPVDALVGAVVVLIEHVHAVFAAGGEGHGVHALGKGHKGDAHTRHFADGIALGLLVFLVAGIGPQGLHAGGPDVLQGGAKAQSALADGVGVGHLNQVHPGAVEGLRQRLGSGAGGAVGLSHQQAFKVQHGKVSIRQQAGHILEGLCIVPGFAPGLNHGVGDVQVACRCHVNHGGGGKGCGFCGLGGLEGFLLGGGFLSLLGKAPEVNASCHQEQYQGSQSQAKKELPPPSPLGLPALFPQEPALFQFFRVNGHRRTSSFFLK